MRIPAWTPALKPQPQELVDAIKARRGGEFINLDLTLLWSEPVARGWNTFLKEVRTNLGTSRKLREIGICTVALLTGAHYEYKHHAPDFLLAGGTQAELDALDRVVAKDARRGVSDPDLDATMSLVIQYAAQLTQDVKIEDGVFEQMKKTFDTTQIVELTTAIATYNMVARVLMALEVNPES